MWIVAGTRAMPWQAYAAREVRPHTARSSSPSIGGDPPADVNTISSPVQTNSIPKLRKKKLAIAPSAARTAPARYRSGS